tara:strand:+ start:385 stop:567 length:183 start_codon:yes stop_codon:yes gene_type:complete
MSIYIKTTKIRSKMKYKIYNEEGILVACDEDSILELLAENGYEIKTKIEKKQKKNNHEKR